MTYVSFYLCTILACFSILQSYTVKASPIFSDDGDKPTPFRYTFRVERVEFGDPQGEDVTEDYPSFIPDCVDYYSDVDYPSESDEDYPIDDEEEEEVGDGEDQTVYDEDDEEEYPSIDEDDDEEGTIYDDENPIFEEEEEEEQTTLNDFTTEGFPEDNEVYSDDDDEYDDEYDDYYEYDYLQDQEEQTSYLDDEIVSLPTVRKRPSHRHRGGQAQKHPERYNKGPFPTWMPAVRRRMAAAHPHKVVQDRKRHQPRPRRHNAL